MKKKKPMGRRRNYGRKKSEFGKDKPESVDPSMERTTLSPKQTMELNLAAVGNKMMMNRESPSKRSLRNRSMPSSSQDRYMEPVIENIEISENEEDNPASYKGKKAPMRIMGANCMEKKIDHLILLLQQEKTGEALLSQEVGRCFSTQNPVLADIRPGMKNENYKNMYIDSQKKIEELQHENYELRKKLETALGKLEGYEKGQLVISEAIGKFKDAFFISSLTKTADMVSGLALPGAIKRRRLTKGEARSPPVGRKKVTKGGKE